jgi:hypothetical protein
VIGAVRVTVSMIVLFQDQMREIVVVGMLKDMVVPMQPSGRRRPMLMRSDRRVRMVHDVPTVEVDVVRRLQARADDGKCRRQREGRLDRDQPSALQGRQV